jgi:hypothetical protein
MVTLNVKLNNSGISAGLRQLRDVSPKLSAHLANKACWGIASRAARSIKIVSPALITTQMRSTAAMAEMASGMLAAKKDRRNRSLTMAQRIVLARMHPNSRFNRMTGGVFKLERPKGNGGSPTQNRKYKLGGQAVSKFMDWVDSRAERMIKARRSSSGFFNLGAQIIRLIFSKSKSPVRVTELGEALPGGGGVSKAIGRVAGGTMAMSGGGVAKASFWVATTEPDSKGANRAIERLMLPHWQKAVDDEAAGITAYAEQLYIKAIQDAGFTVK